MLAPETINPYVGVHGDCHKEIELPNGKKRHFRLWYYQGYNAMGLIGCEFNGIAMADEDTRKIVFDNLGNEGSGFYGPSKSQLALLEKLRTADRETFIKLVSAAPRLRSKTWLYGKY